MKIEVLYPEICNLFGELMNPEYLARSCGAELVYTSLKEKPKFITEDIALVYMGYTTERGEEAVRDAFRPYLEELKKRTDAGGVTLFTGNIIEVFGEYVEDDGGNRIPMLGWFPIHSDRHLMRRYNSLYLGKMGDMTVAGFKSQFGHSYGNVGEGLFTTVPPDDPRLKAEDRLAVVLGTEGDGLSASTVAQCDYVVKIPMKHGVDSLNVSAAAAVVFWETQKMS